MVRLNGNRSFMFMDLKDAYYHVKIRPQDKQKVGIVKPFGTIQYGYLDVGLAGSSFTFTRIMQEVLLCLGNITCFVFMDDVPNSVRT
jgi:hypothetical protein